ncbi:TrmB family transcriptional regulator [Pseudonocardia sp. HH130630-07]|uniref:TrmB family transcriptional regulator n=1 Tax=Pseudonocardia sp. HH130630-07 TaxID=1690815 RepID=UPI00081517A9|nr:TrmB family transcriptional regulator [Pseudonocardia sp. HH130630-07]ANY05854.1 transcriptional regulator TrmB [Pseudonocardia sp. HH130630-07]
MSVQRVIGELQRLGMSGYEAKAYVTLVVAGEPLNGYEVAKRSGVPRSTVYETLGKLVGRGAAYEVRTDDDGVGYVPLPVASLLERMRRDFDRTIDVLEREMPQLSSPLQARLVHSLDEKRILLERAEDVVAAAFHMVEIAARAEDLVALKPELRRAEQRGVDIRVVVYGHDPDPVGRTIEHRYAGNERIRQYPGWRLLVAVADRTQAVVGGLDGSRTRGLYTDDPATVQLAVGHVRGDIVLHAVGERFAAEGFEEFWQHDPVMKDLREEPAGEPS